MKPYFDLIVVVPLEEELNEFFSVFPEVKNHSTATDFRVAVNTGTDPVAMLVIKPEDMGKSHTARAVSRVLHKYDAGVLVCLGIAAHISDDLKLTDVCYTGNLADVLDNAKQLDDKSGGMTIQLSPTHYYTPRELSVSVTFSRIIPELKGAYERWQDEQERFARELVPEPLVVNEQVTISLERPRTQVGSIICGAVTKSEHYKKKLADIDRKILAIETESGGVFEEAQGWRIPALTIRGISDDGGPLKNALEKVSKGRVRRIAARNASTFLKLQLANPYFLNFLKARRISRDSEGQGSLSIAEAEQPSPLAVILTQLSDALDKRLRELSPAFRTQPKGYRLPVPRVREVVYGTTSSKAAPTEISDALQRTRLMLVNVPHTYPDASLAWVIAGDLFETEMGGKPAVPVVITGDQIGPPRGTVTAAAPVENFDPHSLGLQSQIVFIVDNIQLQSKTRMNFLIEEVRRHPEAKFIFLTRSDPNVVRRGEFVTELGPTNFELCDVSFSEVALFIQNNFSMSPSEAEVIALRLQKTFTNFKLSAHPTYFAGISKETLSALLQANRRAELIQLAVDGFLTFLVASDVADVSLSRTTRSSFLRRLAVYLKVEKRRLTRAELVAFTETYAREFDYPIDALDFVHSFLEKGILHFENDSVRFSLPFIESYLLAAELSGNEALALSYFRLDDPDFDHVTFDLYAEIGPSSRLVQLLIEKLEIQLRELQIPDEGTHILLSHENQPRMVSRTDRLDNLRDRLRSAVEDVQKNRDHKERKQRLLDMADRVRGEAAKQTGDATDVHAEGIQAKYETLKLPAQVWAIAIQLLGAGAERLNATTKQNLTTNVVELNSRLVDAWLRIQMNIDFEAIRKRVISPEAIAEFKQSVSETDDEEALKALLSDLVDILHFASVAEPLSCTLYFLCENAHDRVLAMSLEKSAAAGEVATIIRAIWLADLDLKAGRRALSAGIKALPPVPLLRMIVASHLINRAYWSHAGREHRLFLLDAADMALKPLHMRINKKPKLKRELEKLMTDRRKRHAERED